LLEGQKKQRKKRINNNVRAFNSYNIKPAIKPNDYDSQNACLYRQSPTMKEVIYHVYTPDRLPTNRKNRGV